MEVSQGGGGLSVGTLYGKHQWGFCAQPFNYIVSHEFIFGLRFGALANAHVKNVMCHSHSADPRREAA